MHTSHHSHAPAFNGFTPESIDITEDTSVSYWVAALGCSEYELRVAVAEVGTVALDVGTQLGIAL